MTRRHSRRGSNAVEFALLAIPLFGITFASIDYGWYFGVRHVLHNAAYEGARAGSIVAMPSDGGDPPLAATTEAEAAWTSTGMSVTAGFTAVIVGAPPNAAIQVTGNVPSPTLSGLTPIPGGTLDVIVTKRMESQP